MCIINVAGIVNIRLSSFQITDYNADGLKPFHLCFCSSLLHYDYIRYQLVVDVIFTESPYHYHIVWRWRRNRIHSTKKVSLFTRVYKVPARPDVCTADTMQGPRIFNLKAFNRPLFIYLFYYLFIEFATVTQHGVRGCVPIDISPFINHPAMPNERLYHTTRVYSLRIAVSVL